MPENSKFRHIYTQDEIAQMKPQRLKIETRLGYIKEVDGQWVSRIQANRAFGKVNKDQVGGFACYETEISEDGASWVSENATAIRCSLQGQSEISGNAIVVDTQMKDKSFVYMNAKVNNCLIQGCGCIGGNSKVSWAELSASASIRGFSVVSGKGEAVVRLMDSSAVEGNVVVEGPVEVSGDSKVLGRAYVKNSIISNGSSVVLDAKVIDSFVTGGGWIGDQASVLSGSRIENMNCIGGDAIVEKGSVVFEAANVYSGCVITDGAKVGGANITKKQRTRVWGC